MTEASAASSIDKGKTPEQLCQERAKRLDDAIHLRQPDRIPISLALGNLLAEIGGITRQELCESPDMALTALEKAAVRYQPDIARQGFGGFSGPSRVLGDRMTKWPGYGLGENDSYQFHEDEYMKAEDYDAFLADPADWAIRVYLPRVFSKLEGLSKLPNLAMAALGTYGMSMYVADMALPSVVTAFQALAEAGQMQLAWLQTMKEVVPRMAALGFPPSPLIYGGLMAAPFDFMADTLRGMRGIFVDMRRCPEKLLEAEEKVGRMQTENAIARCKARGANSVMIPLHRGSDGFISIPAFERFYWPQFKKMMLDLIEAGITPLVFWEGAWNQRLHYLAELPKGKTVGMFQQSDIFKVKEVLGDTMCIQGGMPVSMLFKSNPEEIREYTKKLCQVVGKGGGFIMSTDIGELEGCDPDLIQVWCDATKEFGVY
jgi:uroporphyrinogen-III decarboxylase